MEYSEVISENNPQLDDLTFYRHEDKLSTELDQETVILDMDSGIYSQLNAVGTTVWNILAKPASLSFIIEKVVSTYEVKEEECREDILKFLRDLADNQLITVEYASPDC